MICPKCGEEIKDGYMYCPKCGEEVIMVPDFEVELEEGIEQTISEVTEMMADSVESINSPEDLILNEEGSTDKVIGADEPDNRSESFSMARLKKTGSGLLIAAAVILGLLFVYGIFRIVVFVNDYYSFDKQFAKAQAEKEAGDYDSAIRTLKHVASLEPRNENVKLMLADLYYEEDKYDESIAVLEELLNVYPTDMGIYERLIADYDAQGDTDSILKLYDKNPQLDRSDMPKGYSSDEPEFNLDEGTYVETQNISITSGDNGIIYYTLDGTEPTVSSIMYDKPISLEEGTTTITAISVNEKGVASEPVSRTYTIELAKPLIPELLTEPGDYNVPELIKLVRPDNGTIYYTTDGTDPDENSIKYEPPIPMPLGKSEFRFIIISEENTASEILTAEYNLSISGNIDKAYAQNAVQLRLMSLGHPVMTHEFLAGFGYSHDGRNYYIVEEFSSDTGKRSKEKTVYAVDSQTGEVFTINRNTAKEDYDFGIVN